MQEIIIDIINRFGYLGIGLLIAIENLFPPIPSEIILTFGGFFTTISSLKVLWVIVSASLGSLVGAVILYCIGRLLKTERLEKLFSSRLAKLMRLKKEDVQKADKWFKKHGGKAVFLGRFIPIVRSLISIPAGATGTKLKVFLPLTLLGTVIWNTALVLLGRAAGAAWESVAEYFDTYSLIILCAICAVLVACVIVFAKVRIVNAKRYLATSEYSLEVVTALPTSITLVAIPRAKYKIGYRRWQDSTEFTGLKPGKKYRILAKYDGEDGKKAYAILKYTHELEAQ
ncbi:MAG: DedA family protein [Christensenellaceae bacterium]|jgi:membrane protein DedA with SNARE-associated domain|nr:DedA family protein [Christensenellaceae bacterium]